MPQEGVQSMKAKRSYTFYDYFFTILATLTIAIGTIVVVVGLYCGKKWDQAKGKIISYVGSGKEIKDNVTRSSTPDPN